MSVMSDYGGCGVENEPNSTKKPLPKSLITVTIIMNFIDRWRLLRYDTNLPHDNVLAAALDTPLCGFAGQFACFPSCNVAYQKIKNDRDNHDS